MNRLAQIRATWFAAAFAAVVFAFLLTGCAAPAPTVPLVAARPVEVRVPVAAPCVRRADLPPAPQLEEDADLVLLGDYELVITLEQHRRALRAYHARAAALLSACASDAPAGNPAAPAALTTLIPLKTEGARQ